MGHREASLEPADRPVKAFCVGHAKSGTASLAGLLGAHYRAAHEPERVRTLEMILREARGEVGDDDVRSYLVERDRRLDLDYDIAWANQFIVGHLMAVFADAMLIVVIRDSFTWLRFPERLEPARGHVHAFVARGERGPGPFVDAGTPRIPRRFLVYST